MQQSIASALKDSKVAICETDTCLGFSTSVFSRDGLANLYDLKGMDRNKPTSILVDSLDIAKEFAVVDEFSAMIMAEILPGPYTILLPRTANLPDFFNPGVEYVGVRMIAGFPIVEVVRELGHPVTTTSANRHGQPTVSSYRELIEQYQDVENREQLLANLVDLLPEEPFTKNGASTILRITNGRIQLLRIDIGHQELVEKFARYID
jgi:tRNA threonylcarbamoyl adenosine modification protein (Sua5/YciO/YrdC/YwlC family)